MKQPVKKIINNLLNSRFKYKFKVVLLKQKIFKRPVNLIIGSGNITYPDWLATDKFLLDITKYKEWAFYFKKDSIDRILAEHVFEHLTDDDRDNALKNISFFLKPGGFIRIAVPDGYFPNPDYIDQVKPGGCGLGADDHKFLYNYNNLGRVLTDFGFNPSFLEYHDENGGFHYKEWDQKQGMIIRSVRFDERNQTGEIRYTSLIIDAYKKGNTTSEGNINKNLWQDSVHENSDN